MPVKKDVLAALNASPVPLTADELADELKDGTTTAALRAFLRAMVDAKEIRCNEKPGARATYEPISRTLAPLKPNGADRAVAPSPAKAAPSLADLLASAQQEPERRKYGPGTEYMPAVHVLRTKRYSWKEISAWFKAKGIELSHSGICTTYKRWVKERPEER